jgi:hypothetical protein
MHTAPTGYGQIAVRHEQSKQGSARRDALPAIITPSEAPTAAASGAGAVSWKAENYCSSQILISGGDPKELGSIYHAMTAWACSNPGILDNGRAIADFLSDRLLRFLSTRRPSAFR